MPKKPEMPLSGPAPKGPRKGVEHSATPIGQVRVKRGYSQEEVARAIGFRGVGCGVTISGWELGRLMPSDRNIEALARLYKIPLGQLRYLFGLTFRDGAANRRNLARLIKPLDVP